jgi:hypothetical protein
MPVVVAACSAFSSPREISRSSAGAFEAALTAAASGPVAAWYDTRDGNGEIYIRRLGADGEPSSGEIRLTRSPEDSYEASVDALGDMLAVAWYDKASDGTLRGRAGLWSYDGVNEWLIDLPPNTRNPVLRANGRQVSLAWIQKAADGTEQVWSGVWNLRGRSLHSQAIGPAHATTWNLNMALDDSGAAWVVYDAVSSTRASELFLARADARRVSLHRLTADDGSESKYPDIAINGEQVALTWFDARDGNTEVYLLATRSSALRDGLIDARARRVTQTPAESIGAYVAWNGDRIGLAWSDAAMGQHEVYFQPFDAGGAPLAPATRLTSTRAASLIPAIEPWRDGFALAWSEHVPTDEPHGGGRSEIAFAIVE